MGTAGLLHLLCSCSTYLLHEMACVGKLWPGTHPVHTLVGSATWVVGTWAAHIQVFACMFPPNCRLSPPAAVVGLSWVPLLVGPGIVAWFNTFAVRFGSVGTIGHMEDGTFLGARESLLSWHVVSNVKPDRINLPIAICG